MPGKNGVVALGVVDRLALLEVLDGVRGDLTTLRLLPELRQALSFTEDEYARFGFAEGPGGELVMRRGVAEVKDVPIGPKMRACIAKQLREMDAQQRLAERHLPIADLFLEGDHAEGD